jgi:ubiquitin C-terminal hydrolase
MATAQEAQQPLLSAIEQKLAFTKRGTGKSTFQNINAVSCYINCALQSLLHLEDFKQVFLAAAEPPPAVITYWSLRALFKGYWEENCVIRPTGMVAYLDKCGFPAGAQGDSTEVLTFIIASLHECIGVTSEEGVPEVGGTPMEVMSIKDWNHHLAKKHSEVVGLFWGQYLTKKQCGTCATPLYKFETFHYLTLAVAQDDEPGGIGAMISFETLVERFRQKKQFDRDNLFFCDTCKQKVPLATDETSVWKLPRHLIVQFNRYHSQGTTIQKCNRVITFPERFDPAILQPEPEGASAAAAAAAVYQLQSGVFHHGQLHGGHYTYFGWNEDTQEWLHCDDNAVMTLTGPVLAHSGIYQLIYKLQICE